jgi:hypothetical protein
VAKDTTTTTKGAAATAGTNKPVDNLSFSVKVEQVLSINGLM